MSGVGPLDRARRVASIAAVGLVLKALALASLSASPLLLATGVSGYPLDAAETTGITRLEGYRVLTPRLLERGTLQPGSLLPSEAIRLRLLERPELELPRTPEPAASARLRALLGEHADRYAIAVLDLSDPDAPRYLAHRPDHSQNPGSVGKILVGLAWLQALADLHPEDVEARAALLRDTEVTANELIRGDHHEVPFWTPGAERIVKRLMREGDRGNLYTYLDWMFSSSSNAAASMLLEQLVLLRQFGAEYPVPQDVARTWLATTPSSALRTSLMEALRSPVERNGLDLNALRQGGLFTREGKRRIPGGDSNSTAAELLRFLLRMEQGRLVDAWSSLELKRLMYLTDRRIRYASAPALSRAAVYFKSGSLYQCQPEEDFVCGKYKGNVRNFMNSVAIVESEEGGRRLHYLVAVLSNVLRENSAVAHQTLALRIHRLIESFHPVPKPEPPPPLALPERESSRDPEPGAAPGPPGPEVAPTSPTD